MRNQRTLAVSFVAFCLALAACHRTVSNSIQITLVPDTASRAVAITCDKSSTGKCHLSFAGSSLSRGDFTVGDTVVFRNVAAGTHYCAESFAVALTGCEPALVPERKQTVSKTTSMSQDAGQ